MRRVTQPATVWRSLGKFLLGQLQGQNLNTGISTSELSSTPGASWNLRSGRFLRLLSRSERRGSAGEQVVTRQDTMGLGCLRECLSLKQ